MDQKESDGRRFSDGRSSPFHRYCQSEKFDDSLPPRNPRVSRPTNLRKSAVASPLVKPRESNAMSHQLTSPQQPFSHVLQGCQRVQFFKTRMCSFLSSNHNCVKGAECNYAHNFAELRPSINLLKTKLCADFVNKGCEKSASECKFAHGVADLRTTSGFFKASCCKFWSMGSCCPSGDLCRHAHGEEANTLKSPATSTSNYYPFGFPLRNKKACVEQPADCLTTLVVSDKHWLRRRKPYPTVSRIGHAPEIKICPRRKTKQNLSHNLENPIFADCVSVNESPSVSLNRTASVSTAASCASEGAYASTQHCRSCSCVARMASSDAKGEAFAAVDVEADGSKWSFIPYTQQHYSPAIVMSTPATENCSSEIMAENSNWNPSFFEFFSVSEVSNP